jgi:hemerythrin-like domain-containing protein
MIRDPLAKLMEDHRRFLRTVAAFRTEWRGSGSPRSAEAAAPRQVDSFARFLREDVDRLHGQQEERGLFPVLARHIPIEAGPIGVMLEEHSALRTHEELLRRAGQKLEQDAEATEWVQRIDSAAGEVEELLGSHIMKEDTILFPMSYDVLTPRELLEIDQVFRQVEAELGRPAP